MVYVCLLGSGGTMPAPSRFLSSLLVECSGEKLLIDCGEGTQVSLKILGRGIKNLSTILITHLHGDHIYGIFGLLLTLGNSGRNEKVKIVGPIGTKYFIDFFMSTIKEMPFKIEVTEINSNTKIKCGPFIVSTLMVSHSILCIGYSLYLERGRKFIREKAESLSIPKIYWNKLKKGETINHGHTTFSPDMVLSNMQKGIKISFITDTRPTNFMEDFIEGSDLFICEAMYDKDEYLEKAIKSSHMLMSEAALLANKGNVKRLWLTHFSPSIDTPSSEPYKNIYENIELGFDRKEIELNFEE